MKSLNCINSKEFANKMYSLMRGRAKKYTLRPRNRFDNETSLWWLVPSTEFPAYRFGKYVFCENTNSNRLFAGIHIEKGTKSPIDNPSGVIDGSWVWYDFLESLTNGEIENILNRIENKYKDGISIEICLDIQGESDRKIEFKNASLIDSKTKNSISFAELKEYICSRDGIDWLWVDLFILFGFEKESSQVEGIISEYDIRNDILEQFEPWIR